MAHNFKLSGSYYVSIDGSDSNSGTTKDAPKRTLQAALSLSTANTIIVGAGTYDESLSRGISGASVSWNHIFVADGSVVITNINQNKVISFTEGGINVNQSSSWNGFIFKNVIFSFQHDTDFGGAFHTFTNCIFYNVTFTNSIVVNQNTNGYSFTNCIFINCNIAYTVSVSLGTAISSFNKCIFINSTIGSGATITTFLNCYSYASLIYVRSTATTGTFNYNNIEESTIIMPTATSVTTGLYQDVSGKYYDLTQPGTNPSGDGSLAQPFYRAQTINKGFNYSTHRSLYPTFNANSFSRDPRFNNITTRDFTLQADSPHLGMASDATNIGGTKYAIRDSAIGDVYNTSAISVTDLDFIGSDYRVTSPATNGEVIGAPRLVRGIPIVLQRITYNGYFGFNKSITGGDYQNMNVPDQEVYDSTVQPPDVVGANPDRLVYYMRFSTQIAEPATSGEWDNGGLWTAGNYGTFEWNTKPVVDNLGIGNGDPTFNVAATPVALSVTWIQLKIKLRNDY